MFKYSLAIIVFYMHRRNKQKDQVYVFLFFGNGNIFEKTTMLNTDTDNYIQKRQTANINTTPY